MEFIYSGNFSGIRFVIAVFRNSSLEISKNGNGFRKCYFLGNFRKSGESGQIGRIRAVRSFRAIPGDLGVSQSGLFRNDDNIRPCQANPNISDRIDRGNYALSIRSLTCIFAALGLELFSVSIWAFRPIWAIWKIRDVSGKWFECFEIFYVFCNPHK